MKRSTDERLGALFAKVSHLPEFLGIEMSDINTCGHTGDNALHVVAQWGDLASAKLLIERGIDVNKPGDLGYTPLHVASRRGDMQMVKLLIEHGADLFVLSEGDSPFATARLAGHDEICEFLARLMKKAKESDPNIWLRSRLGQLQREIADIQKKLAAEKQTSIQANSRSS